MKYNVLGICNLHDSPTLGALTSERPIGPTTFLGRYGLMDFVLSNFANSGINKVDILIEGNYQSVKNHVRNGSIWVNNTKTGFQRLYFNEKLLSSHKFNTDISNIKANNLVKKELGDFIVIAPAFFVMSIDYSSYIEKYIASGADIGLIYAKPEDPAERFANCDKITISKDGFINKFEIVSEKDAKANVSLESFILKVDVFKELIKLSESLSSLFTFRQLIKYVVENKMYKVKPFEFKEKVFPFLSFEGYYRESMSMLSSSNRRELFKDDWPIYTTTHNTPPSIYGAKADVQNSFIANGCQVNGRVLNSVLSRNVIIEEGASVENCILFTDTVVAKGIHLNNVVCDKYCKFVQSKDVKGTQKNPLYIPLGEII